MIRYNDIESLVADGIIEKDHSMSNCVVVMKGEFVEYVTGVSTTFSYPVLEMFSNPRKSMQGGFISAAFDNTFGFMVYLSTKQVEMATIDLHISYHKPIFENDKLTVTVYIKSLGKTIIHLIGEAYDGEKNLIASASTNFFLLRKD